MFCENEPNTDTQANKIDASEKDYLFYIANPDITNEIKNYEVYSPSKETYYIKTFTKNYPNLKKFTGLGIILELKKKDKITLK